MLWYYTKLSENSKTVVYSYSRTTKENFGELMYDKTTKEYSVLKVADNDTDGLAEWALSHFPKVIEKGFPEKDIVMIG
jgi:uncharacterized protein YlbG (UPF0298 family)